MNYSPHIESGWSLYLDRDGVINRKVKGGYVLSREQFEFMPGVLEALAILSNHFKYLFIVTNQQCVGKGLITMDELSSLHRYMLDQIENSGGKIGDIFVSPWLESDNHPDRKPSPGMAYESVKRHPDIELNRSVMAGDSLSDMQFGRRAGMVNILVGDADIRERDMYDLRVASLLEFAKLVMRGEFRFNTGIAQ